MSSGSGHVGERLQLLHAALWAFIACTAFALAVDFYLLNQKRIGLPGAAGILLLGWLLAAGITFLSWRAGHLAGRGMAHVLMASGNLAPTKGYSLEQSMVIRGAFEEAAASYRRHWENPSRDFTAGLALAALLRDHLDDTAGAERLLLDIRALRPPETVEFGVANALIDLYRRRGDRGRELTELARFADRFRHSPEGARAREALLRIKADSA